MLVLLTQGTAPEQRARSNICASSSFDGAGGAPGFDLQREGLHFTDTCLSPAREITWARVATFMINSGIIPYMGRNNPNKPLCKMLQTVVNV